MLVSLLIPVSLDHMFCFPKNFQSTKEIAKEVVKGMLSQLHLLRAQATKQMLSATAAYTTMFFRFFYQ